MIKLMVGEKAEKRWLASEFLWFVMSCKNSSKYTLELATFMVKQLLGGKYYYSMELLKKRNWPQGSRWVNGVVKLTKSLKNNEQIACEQLDEI